MNISALIRILHNTAPALKAMLSGIGDELIYANEGANTWTPFDVIGHLIVCEETNFMQRIKMILSSTGKTNLQPIDMTAQFEQNKQRSLSELLREFEKLRNDNLAELNAIQLSGPQLVKEANHPTLGTITLQNILATWAAHDLSHIAQITRVMAKQYTGDIGPFVQYLRILK